MERTEKTASTEDYTPKNPQAEEASASTAKPVAVKKVYEKDPAATALKDLTPEFMEKLDFDVEKREGEKVKVKTHLKIRKPKRGGSKDTEALVVALPTGYVSLRVSEGTFGKKRTMRYSWIDEKYIVQIETYYKNLFDKMIDFVMGSFVPNFVPATVKVKVDGTDYNYDKYHELLDEIASKTKTNKKSKKPEVEEEIEDMQELADKIEKDMREEIWKVCRMNRAIGVVQDAPGIRSKYIEMTSYPTKKPDNIDEKEYERRQQQGNMSRVIFWGSELLNRPTNKEKRILFEAKRKMIDENFVTTAAEAREGRVIYTVPKSGNGRFFYDRHMVVSPVYDGKTYCYKCGLDLKQSHFRMSVADSGEATIVLEEDYSACEFYNFVEVPAQLKVTRDNSRERESNADDAAAPIEAGSTVDKTDGLGVRMGGDDEGQEYTMAHDGDDEGNGGGYDSA